RPGAARSDHRYQRVPLRLTYAPDRIAQRQLPTDCAAGGACMTLHLFSRPRAAWYLAAAVVFAVSGFASSPAGAAPRRSAVAAAALGSPYPKAPDCDETNGHNGAKDKWGFVQGQCHSWVAYRLNELNADELDGTTFGDYWHLPAGEEWGSVWHWSQAATDAG